MTEGYFIKGQKFYQVQDHEMWLRDSGGINARLLGASAMTVAMFKDFAPVKERCQFLSWFLGKIPAIRARGHGIWVSCEWGCCGNQKAFRAIHKWGKAMGLGPCMMLRMVNLMTGEQFNMFWLLFDEAIRSGHPLPIIPP